MRLQGAGGERLLAESSGNFRCYLLEPCEDLLDYGCGWSAVVRTDQEVAMLRNGDWTRQTTVPSSRAQDDDLVMSLVEVTLAQPKQERERYLSSVCAQDSELFKEVRKYEE